MENNKRGGGRTTRGGRGSAGDVRSDEYSKQLGLVGLQLLRLSEMGPQGVSGFPQMARGGYSTGHYSPAYSRYDDRMMGRRGRDRRMYSSYSAMSIESGEPIEAVIANDKPIGVYMTKSPHSKDDEYLLDIRNKLDEEPANRAGSLVYMTNAQQDIVDPLYYRLSTFHEAELDEMQVQHHEDTLYYKTMIKSLEETKDGVTKERSGFFLKFMAAIDPMWNVIKKAAESKDLVSSILWGFKTEESSAERIIAAIDRQTEWHMNNSIDQSEGFFTRLFKQGIVGMPLRMMADALADRFDVGRKRAQTDEDVMASGGQADSGLRGQLARYLYGSQIELKGRGGGNSGSGYFQEKVLDFIDVYELLIFDATRRLYVPAAKSIIQFTDFIFPEIMKRQREIHSRQNWHLIEVIDELKVIEHQGSSFNRLSLSHDEERAEYEEKLDETQTGMFKKIVKNTDETAEEVKKFRHQSFWMSLLQMTSSLLGKMTALGVSALAMLSRLKPIEKLKDLWNLFKGSKFFSGAKDIVEGVVDTAKSVTQKGAELAKRGLEIGKKGTENAKKIGREVSDAVVDAYKKADSSKLGKFARMPTVGFGVSIGAGILADQVEEGTYAHAMVKIIESTADGAGWGGMAGLITPIPGATLAGTVLGGMYGLGTGTMDAYKMLKEQEEKNKLPPAPPSPEKTFHFIEETQDSLDTQTNLLSNVVEDTEIAFRRLRDNVREKAKEISSPLENRPYVEHRGEGMFKSNAVAIQQAIGISSDTVSGAFKELKNQAQETLGIMKDQAQHEREMVELLKAIAGNTKMTEGSKARFETAQDAIVNSMLFGKK